MAQPLTRAEGHGARVAPGSFRPRVSAGDFHSPGAALRRSRTPLSFPRAGGGCERSELGPGAGTRSSSFLISGAPSSRGQAKSSSRRRAAAAQGKEVTGRGRAVGGRKGTPEPLKRRRAFGARRGALRRGPGAARASRPSRPAAAAAPARHTPRRPGPPPAGSPPPCSPPARPPASPPSLLPSLPVAGLTCQEAADLLGHGERALHAAGGGGSPAAGDARRAVLSGSARPGPAPPGGSEGPAPPRPPAGQLRPGTRDVTSRPAPNTARGAAHAPLPLPLPLPLFIPAARSPRWEGFPLT